MWSEGCNAERTLVREAAAFRTQYAGRNTAEYTVVRGPDDVKTPAPTGRVLARRTGLEPAASGVTGRRYNQLNYRRIPRRGSPLGTRFLARALGAVKDLQELVN